MVQKLMPLKGWALLVFLIAFSYVYPRLLINTLGEDNPWTSYFYLYGFGTLYTGSGVLLALKSGACRLSRPRDLFWLRMIIAGFLYFAALHGVWIYLALSVPYLGGQ
jgi:hypothetical protein